MPFHEEVVVAGKAIKRVHVIYRAEKIVNVGIANLTDRQAEKKVKDEIAVIKSEMKEAILKELAPAKKSEVKTEK